MRATPSDNLGGVPGLALRMNILNIYIVSESEYIEYTYIVSESEYLEYIEIVSESEYIEYILSLRRD